MDTNRTSNHRVSTRSTRVQTIPASGMQGTVLHFLNRIGDQDVPVLKEQEVQPVTMTVHMKEKLNKETGKYEPTYFILVVFQRSNDRAYLRPTHDLVAQGVLGKNDAGEFYPLAEELGYEAGSDESVAGRFVVGIPA